MKYIPLQLKYIYGLDLVEKYCPPNCGGPPRLPDGRVQHKEWKDRGPKNVPAPRSVGGGKPPQPVKKEYSSFTNVADLHTAILQDHGDVIGKIKMSSGVDKQVALAHSKIIGNEMSRLKQEFPDALKNLKVSVKRIELASEMTKRSPSGGVEKSNALATWTSGTRVMRINVMHKNADTAMSDDQVTLGRFHSVSGKGVFSSVSGTFRHELGHAVHDRVGPSSRGKFDRIIDRLADVKGSISKYGATDKREAFAEAFAAYTSPSYKGNLPKEVHKYFSSKFPKAKVPTKAIGWAVEPLQAAHGEAFSCQTCVHFDGHYTCPAYPNGVPMSLYLGIKKHTQVLGCQDGELTWESKQALEMDIVDFLNLVPARRFGSYHGVEAFCPPNCGGPPRGADGKVVRKSDKVKDAYKPAGKMSEKDIEDAILDWDKHGDKTMARIGGNEDKFLKHVMSRNGFSGTPSLVDKAEMDKLVASGKVEELFRGVSGIDKTRAEAHADQFKTGSVFVGTGMYGNGTYVGYGEKGKSAAMEYAGREGVLMRMGLRSDAKVIGIKELDKIATELENSGKMQALSERLTVKHGKIVGDKVLNFMNEYGTLATSLGYDAIRADRQKYMVILNRTALVVEK